MRIKLTLHCWFFGFLVQTSCIAEIQTRLSGEHGVTKFSGESDRSSALDHHKITGAMDWQFSENWQLKTTLSIENGFNTLYPGDGIHTQNTQIILEQAALIWRYSANHRVAVGRFYVPIGTLNGRTNTVNNYGVQRNPVEINIIPTNWVVTGIQFYGNVTEGLSYDVAMHSALVMPDGGLVRDGRTPDSFSISKAHAFTLRAQYTGVAGLLLSSSIHFEVDTTRWSGWGNNSAIMIENHGEYRINKFGIKVFYAYWDIDGVHFERNGREKQNGWYLQTDYRFSPSVGTYVRINEWDNEQDNHLDTRSRQVEVGLNWWFYPNFVIKADFASLSKAADNNQLNLGFAWRW